MTARLLIAACALCVLVSLPAAGETKGGDAEAGEAVTLKIEDMEFCTGIESWAPVGTGKEFPATVAKVYCFTRVNGAAESTEIVHVWYFNDEEKARVPLSVKSNSWRTWSSKRILESWTGKWRVDVLAADGKLLRSSEFLVETKSVKE